MTLQRGEPLVHPEVVQLVSQTVATGISCAIITNGWFLSRYIKSLAAAGLYQLIETAPTSRSMNAIAAWMGWSAV